MARATARTWLGYRAAMAGLWTRPWLGHGRVMARPWPGHGWAMAGPRPGTPYWIWKAFCFRHDMALELVCGAAGQVQKPLIEIRR